MEFGDFQLDFVLIYFLFRPNNGLGIWAAWLGLYHLEQILKYNNNKSTIYTIFCFSHKVIFEVCDVRVER